jgi:phage repressor protein C with HTH and peptisase S24 domain
MQENNQEKSPIKQRILLFLAKKGVTQYEFYKNTGVTRGVLAQNNGISEDNLSRFLAYYKEVSIEWLLTGEGSMLKSAPEERGEESSAAAAIAQRADTGEGIPLIPFDAMAGVFRGEVSALESACDRLAIPGLRADFVIRVAGNSMEPCYYSGDMVACQQISLTDIFFQWGRTYVIDTEQGVLIKRVKKGSSNQTITLVSENPEYAPFEIPRENVIHIALVKALVRIE